MSKRDILIGVDAGTSVIKAVAFDMDGNIVAMTNRANSYERLPGGGVEQNMRRTWEDTAAVLRELMDVPDLAARVLALAVTGQGDGTWLVDDDGEPVHDGWLWLDARAVEEANAIEASDEMDLIYERTGSGVNVCQMRTHLVWMKRHAPELLARAASALHCKDWLYLKLTGERATDPSESVFTFGDFRTRMYSDEVIAALGLSDERRLLPPIVDGSQQAHALTAQAAAQTGLPAGLPVSLGMVDVVCTAIGAGLHDPAVRPGLTILGTTGMHMRFVAKAEDVQLNPDRSGYTMTLPGAALAQVQTNMAATLNIDWVLDLAIQVLATQDVTCTRSDLLQGLDERVLQTQPGAAVYHPYISSAGERGPFTQPYARASFTGLDQSTGWFDMVRAVFDGLALAARDCYTAMGEMPAEVRLSGGAARSRALKAMLASAVGVPVRTVAQEEAGAAGAVMMAAQHLGLFSDTTEITNAWVAPRLSTALQPDAKLSSQYDKMFEAYAHTRREMTSVWDAQATMRGALS